eukprot:248743-Prymnesium_polylepis.1
MLIHEHATVEVRPRLQQADHGLADLRARRRRLLLECLDVVVVRVEDVHASAESGGVHLRLGGKTTPSETWRVD